MDNIDYLGLLGIVGRSVGVYVFMLLAIRLFGKKELAQLSTIDLVFILLISNSVQNAMVGSNTTLYGGLVAAGSLFVVNYFLKLIIYKNKKINEFIQGDPITLIYDGQIMEKNLEVAKISIDEMKAAIREHGVEKISEVNLSVLEVDGSISVLSNSYLRKTKHRRKVKESKAGL